MMELVRDWLLGVTGAAILAAVADGLMPEGGVKRVGKLITGLILLAAVLRPVLGADPADLEVLGGTWEMETALSTQELEQQRQSYLESIIAQEAGAYISDKAEELGLSCTARVTCAPGEEGLPIPQGAQITGALTQAQQTKLSAAVAGELGIPRDRIIYTEEATG